MSRFTRAELIEIQSVLDAIFNQTLITPSWHDSKALQAASALIAKLVEKVDAMPSYTEEGYCNCGCSFGTNEEALRDAILRAEEAEAALAEATEAYQADVERWKEIANVQ